jgi:hypothetical protein
MNPLTVEDLLQGGRAVHRLEVPLDVLAPAGAPAGAGVPAGSNGAGGDSEPSTVVLRPLLLADLQRIQKAARQDETLTSVLMVQQALVEPAVSIDQVNHMHAGLVEFLLGEVNRISGLSLTGDQLTDVVQAPMARACFELSRHFGWTPEECAALTVGQLLLYLEMLGRGESPRVVAGD